MNIGRACDDYPYDAETIVMNTLPRQEQQSGHNSFVNVFEGVVIKSTQRAHSYEYACATAERIGAYYRDMKDEPVAVASVEVGVIKSQGGFYAAQAVERIHGQNLVQLEGEQLRSAIGELIWSICHMRAFEGGPGRPFDSNILRSGIDAQAKNFIVDASRTPMHPSAVVRDHNGVALQRTGTPVLIDHLPALKRHMDGLLRLGKKGDDAPFWEVICGTRSGAIATLLYTGLYLKRGARNMLPEDEAAFYREWQDLVPPELHTQVWADLRLYAQWYARLVCLAAVNHMTQR